MDKLRQAIKSAKWISRKSASDVFVVKQVGPDEYAVTNLTFQPKHGVIVAAFQDGKSINITYPTGGSVNGDR